MRDLCSFFLKLFFVLVNRIVFNRSNSLMIKYLIACLMNYKKYNKGSFKKDVTEGRERGYPRMVTNGDIEGRGV